MTRFPVPRLPHLLREVALIVCGLLLPWGSVHAAGDGTADGLPPNLGKGLRQMIVWHRSQRRDLSAVERRAHLAEAMPGRGARLQLNEDATRVVVDVMLDGSAPLATVRAGLSALGMEILGEYDQGRPGSILSASLPLDQAEAAARLPGVYSIMPIHKPWRRVGLATSQGLRVLQADKVQQTGYDGTGITVGVISDSFDEGKYVSDYHYATDAAKDILNGDLPGHGNPLGHTTPVRVLADGADASRTDEGRALLQIVHDLAPGARLMFQAAGSTPETLAAAITNLRSQTDPSCDVIVDDFGFPEEPFFSDGPAALAARAAATSLLLPGRPVVYVSSAGNAGDVGYTADFNPVSDANARAGKGAGNLKLDQVPPSLTAGGFHNFKTGSKKAKLGQKIKIYGDAEIGFQWDDLFGPGKVTTDYNLLVFDQDGNYLADLSGTENNVTMGTAVEVVDLPMGDGVKSTTYQLAITRSKDGSTAQHLRYVVNGGAPTISFRGYNNPTTFGHNAGPSVIGVAAYAYDHLAEPESFSGLGPVPIYFDVNGRRLATPELRQQPSVAAVDGVDTSFFPPGPLTATDGSPGTDTDSDGYPNFFGTSAAAPHVAAVAALLLQAAGGPGSLTAAQVQALLQSTALPHDLDPNFTSVALAPGGGSAVTLSCLADESNIASEDSKGFHLSFDGTAGQSLRKLVINLSPTTLKFDPSADLGFAFTIGGAVGVDPAEITSSLDETNRILALHFAPGAFGPGASLDFGIDRDLRTTGTDGNSADLLAGAKVKAQITDGTNVSQGKGAMANEIGTGYSPASGSGLINADAAVQSLLANPPPPKTGRLTSGDILLTSTDNHILEIRPDGTQVQTFSVPPDPTNGAVDSVYEKTIESVVDSDGDVALLYNAFTNYLFIIDPATGASKMTLTAPDWGDAEIGPIDRIAAVDRFIFATYSHKEAGTGEGLLLRFNPATGAVKAFGDYSGASGNFKSYTTIAAGPDDLLYALVYPNSSVTPVDVYDPKTLALVRTITLNFPGNKSPSGSLAGDFTVGPNGEIYATAYGTDNSALFKMDANGQPIATLALPYANPDSYASALSANSGGEVVASQLDPILIAPDFLTATVLEVFSDITYTYEPSVIATFVP